ncbi:hypothetical protein RQP46_011256 [Phenoliferia psychrophenolica]
MSSLLALVVVASSSRGHSVVFSYPPVPKPVKRTQKPAYATYRQTPDGLDHGTGPDADSTKGGDSDESGSDSDTDEASSRGLGLDELVSGAGRGGRGERVGVGSYLGFSDTVLATLLCPNRELCDQPFELVVDHLAFVGHPVWLGDEEPQRRPADTPIPTSNRTPNDDYDDDDDEEERGRSRRRRGAGGGLESTASSPHLPLPGSSTRDSTVRPSPIPSPSAPSSPETATKPSSSIASSQQSHTSTHGEGRLTSFNFVCVIDTPPDGHLSSHLEGYYKDVVLPITANLKALERRNKWLGKEAAKLRKAREQFSDQAEKPVADYFASLPDLSSLAAAISQLFTALKNSETANITFRHLPVQVLLRGELPIEDADHDESSPAPFDDPATRAPSEADGSPSTPPDDSQRQRAPLFSRMRKRPPVRFQPWETLLLVEHPEDLQRDVVQGSLIWRYLEICDPTLSFAEYEALLDIDSKEEGSMKGIVEHFIHWKKGRVIDVLSLKSTYAISASFSPASLSTLSPIFRAAYPLLPPLAVLLSRLSPTEPYSSIVPIPSLRATYLDALAWLLRQDLLEKQYSYIRLVVSEDTKRGASMHWGDRTTDEDNKGPSIILEPGRPTAVESKWLLEICREKDKSVVEKFDRMVRMLNGAYHLDEIRYRANLSRKDLKTVLTAFSDHLIVFTHPRA